MCLLCYESLLHFHLRSPVSPSLPVYKGLPAGSVTFQQLNTFPGFFCDDWRRQPGLFALLLFGRTDGRTGGWMDGWMDLWVSKRKLTPFYKFIYFCVYGIDRRKLIRSNTGRLSTAGIYSETHCQPKGCCTTERLIRQASNYIHLWWYATLLYVHKGTNKYP